MSGLKTEKDARDTRPSCGGGGCGGSDSDDDDEDGTMGAYADSGEGSMGLEADAGTILKITKRRLNRHRRAGTKP